MQCRITSTHPTERRDTMINQRIQEQVISASVRWSGLDLVNEILTVVARETKCDFAFIGILKDASREVIEACAVLDELRPGKPFEYVMRDTPCALAYHGDPVSVPCEVQTRFAAEAGSGLESFFGVPITHPTHGVVAHLALYDSTPRRFDDIDETTAALLQGLLAREASDVLRESDDAYTALQREVDRWRTEALTDRLTRLANRRALEERWALGPGTSLALVDIDHFKSINDQHGHDVGDDCLRHISRVLDATTDQSTGNDIVVYRLGGEEFCCVAWNTEFEDLAAFLEDARRRLKASWPAAGLPRFTFSAGTCAADQGGLGNSLRQADELMYRAKAGGRDRIEVAES